MNKQKLNYIINCLSFIAFLTIAVSGLIIYFFLPDGIRRGGYQEFFGITKHVWINIHNIFGLIFLFLVSIHFILHWNWIVSMTKNMFSGKSKKKV